MSEGKRDKEKGRSRARPAALWRAMRFFLLPLPFSFLFAPSALAGDIGADCTQKGFPLWGDVQIVESFPDLKVQVVESFPDLKVKLVESFPDSCGKWKYVTSFPDMKIQFVESFPDLKIQFVESFPGVP